MEQVLNPFLHTKHPYTDAVGFAGDQDPDPNPNPSGSNATKEK